MEKHRNWSLWWWRLHQTGTIYCTQHLNCDLHAFGHPPRSSGWGRGTEPRDCWRSHRRPPHTRTQLQSRKKCFETWIKTQNVVQWVQAWFESIKYRYRSCSDPSAELTSYFHFMSWTADKNQCLHPEQIIYSLVVMATLFWWGRAKQVCWLVIKKMETHQLSWGICYLLFEESLLRSAIITSTCWISTAASRAGHGLQASHRHLQSLHQTRQLSHTCEWMKTMKKRQRLCWTSSVLNHGGGTVVLPVLLVF